MIVFLFVVGSLLVLLALRRCRHADRRGSWLVTEFEGGHVYGRCARCHRRTPGWAVPWTRRPTPDPQEAPHA